MTDFLNDDVEGCRVFADDVELERSPGLFRSRTFNPVKEGDPWSETGNGAWFSDVGICPILSRDSVDDTDRDLS